MIFNGILILVAVAVTAWVAFIGFTDGWTLKLVGLLIAVAALGSWLLISRWQYDQAFKSLPKLVAAMQAYSHDQLSHGRPAPSSVTLQDLVGGGYVSTNEVRDLGGADVTFHPTVSESDPQAILVSVRMPNGSQIAAFAYGSIAQLLR